MSVYVSRLFPKSNSSFFLQSGTALKAKAVRVREDTYLIDAGVGRPRTALANELIDPPKSAGPATFSTKVGFLHAVRGESTVRSSHLQRCFVDLVTGDSRTKQNAAARFDDMVGQTDSACGGEQPLLLPRIFRKQRAWLELQNKWKFNRKVRGFIAGKVRGGYSVGIAGYLAFLPARNVNNRRIDGDRYMIESLSPRTFVVTKQGCVDAKGEEYSDCDKFANYYYFICPGEWAPFDQTLYSFDGMYFHGDASNSNYQVRD